MSQPKKTDFVEAARPQFHIFGELPAEQGLELSKEDICTRLVLQLKSEQLEKKIKRLLKRKTEETEKLFPFWADKEEKK